MFIHCLLLQADHSPWVRDGFKRIRKGWDLFLNGKKDPDCADGKKAKRIVTLVVLVFCKCTLKSLLFVSKACLSVLSGRIMRSLSVSLSLSHESQSIWFYANKRGAGPIKSLCVRGAPPHTLSELLQSKRRERESVITYYSLSSLVKMATQGRVQTLLFTLHTAHHLIILLTAPAHCYQDKMSSAN